MRWWDLTLICILFQGFGTALLSAGLFEDMGMDSGFELGDTTATDITQVESNIKGSVDTGVSGESLMEKFIGFINMLVSKTVGNFFNPLKKYISFPSKIMAMFGIPEPIRVKFTAIFTLIQTIGILQFLSGRSFKEAE